MSDFVSVLVVSSERKRRKTFMTFLIWKSPKIWQRTAHKYLPLTQIASFVKFFSKKSSISKLWPEIIWFVDHGKLNANEQIIRQKYEKLKHSKKRNVVTKITSAASTYTEK